MELRTTIRNVDHDDMLRAHVEHRLGFALDRFRDRVRWVEARVSDVNGPKGGADKRCTLEAGLDGVPDVRVEVMGEDAAGVIDQAADRLARRVARVVDRAHDRRRLRGRRRIQEPVEETFVN